MTGVVGAFVVVEALACDTPGVVVSVADDVDAVAVGVVLVATEAVSMDDGVKGVEVVGVDGDVVK